VEYKRPTGAYPLLDFHKICGVCTPFQDALGVKIWLDLLEGLWSYGVLSSGGLVTPKFSVPLAAKLCSLSTVPIFPIFSYIFKAPITSYIFAHFLYFPVFFVIVCTVIVRVVDLVTN